MLSREPITRLCLAVLRSQVLRCNRMARLDKDPSPWEYLSACCGPSSELRLGQHRSWNRGGDSKNDEAVTDDNHPPLPRVGTVSSSGFCKPRNKPEASQRRLHRPTTSMQHSTAPGSTERGERRQEGSKAQDAVSRAYPLLPDYLRRLFCGVTQVGLSWAEWLCELPMPSGDIANSAWIRQEQNDGVV